MQWKLTVLMVLANAITKTRMDQQAIPKTEVYRPTKELWSETESLLDCDFKNGPCYWRQQVDYSDSFPTWNHELDPPGLSILANESGTYEHIPKLVSPIIDVDTQNCFSFSYLSNVTISLIQEHSITTSPGKVIFRSSNYAVTNMSHGHATLLQGQYHLYFQVEDDVHAAPLVILSNFTVSSFNESICKQNPEDTGKVKESSGAFTLQMFDSKKSCQWIQFDEGFHKIPEVVMQSSISDVRTMIDYVGFSGFRVCAFGSNLYYSDSVHVKWRATECFASDQFKCSSGECIGRRGICDGRADCLSADDENTDLCAAAMGTLAFSTFASTIMTTYLITYLKYVRDIRQVFLDPLTREEARLESIHMRELSREALERSSDTLNIPVE